MKKINIITLAMLSSISLVCEAQQPPPPPEATGPDSAQMTEYLKAAQAHMLLMQDLSIKILSEKNPQKQQALKDQQLELMREEYRQMMQNRRQ